MNRGIIYVLIASCLAACSSDRLPYPGFRIALRSSKPIYKVGDEIVLGMRFKYGAEIHRDVSNSLSLHIFEARSDIKSIPGDIGTFGRPIFSRSVQRRTRDSEKFKNEPFLQLSSSDTFRIRGIVKSEGPKRTVSFSDFGSFTVTAPKDISLFFWYCPKEIVFADSLEDYSNPIRVRIE